MFLLGGSLERGGAVGFGQDALHVFELDGGVEDVEAFAEDVVDAAEDGVALRRRHVVNQDVATEGTGFGTEAPDVEIVDVDDAFDLAQFGGYFFQLEAFGETF
jgi:hypothetical protein